MSEAADKLCVAISHEAEKQRQQVLVSIKIDLSMLEAKRLADESKFQDKSFQHELRKRMLSLLRHISPDCTVRFPDLESGRLNCFGISYTSEGNIKTNLIAEAFAFPQRNPK